MEADDTRYVSPDGTLTFIVRRYPGDVVLGFEGTPWHLHGDTLAELSGYSIDEAVSQFLEDLQQGQLVIAIARTNCVVLHRQSVPHSCSPILAVHKVGS